jgi:hypothetical protein
MTIITVYTIIIKNPTYLHIKPFIPLKINIEHLNEIIRDFDVQAIISDKIIPSFDEKIIYWIKNHDLLYVSNIYDKYGYKIRRSPRLNKFWNFDKNILNLFSNYLDRNEKYQPTIKIDYNNKILILL